MIFDNLFKLMADKQASDLFITAGAPIQIKIQGQTMSINQQIMEPPMIHKMISEALTQEQLQKFTREREINLSFGRTDIGNFRLNMFWQRNSAAVVIRYIQYNIPSLSELELPPVLADLALEKRGLILVVGATGSGKSSTLASMIDHRSHTRSGHILTIEDPIEFVFRHNKSIVNQREIGIDTLSWQHALRNAMRQAPDCILIGEIRDRDTMQAAISYAQSGHLCLATLHANNAYHALNSIVNFFPPEVRHLLYLDLSVALRCIVSQRLVHKHDTRLTPAVEILLNTRHISELIEHGKFNEIKEAMESSLAQGSRTFEQDLCRLYRDNIISLEEALANADSATNLSWLINNDKGDSDNVPTKHTSNSALLNFDATQSGAATFSDMTIDFG